MDEKKRKGATDVATWTGPVVKRHTSGDVYRLSFFRDGVNYKIGDLVNVYAESAKREYVAKILQLWEDRTGEMWMECQWCALPTLPTAPVMPRIQMEPA